MGPEVEEERKAGGPIDRGPLGDTELDELLSHRQRSREEPDDLYDGEW